MAHANLARITTFLPCDDADACMMAPDVVSFAIARGYYHGAPDGHARTCMACMCTMCILSRAWHALLPGAPDDAAFSFSDVYDPVTFEGARFCEARVWAIFSAVADPASFDPKAYLS